MFAKVRHEAQKNKSHVWLKRTQKEKEFDLVTNRLGGLEFSLERDITVCPLTDPCLKSCFWQLTCVS